jgi:hypothetical protein
LLSHIGKWHLSSCERKKKKKDILGYTMQEENSQQKKNYWEVGVGSRREKVLVQKVDPIMPRG